MKRHAQRGSSMVEMVIAVGALLALIFGIIDCGRALYTYEFVAQLAREGARWAIVRGSGCAAVVDECNASRSQIQTYVQSLSEGATNPSSIVVTTNWPNNNLNAAGDLVQVNVSYPFKFMGVLPGVTIQMSSTSQMVISQ
jgi:Flp pilus assembly protein TadG